MVSNGDKIDTIRDFSDKGLRELEFFLEPWIRGLMKGKGEAVAPTPPESGIFFDTTPQEGGFLEVTTLSGDIDLKAEQNIDLSAEGDVTVYAEGNLKLTSIPVTDPSVPYAIWADDGVLVFSGFTVPEGGASGPPSGPAGGVLSGVYPNPGFAQDMATQAELNALAAAAVLDGDAAGGVLAGSFPNPGFAVNMATQAELDTALLALREVLQTYSFAGPRTVANGTMPWRAPVNLLLETIYVDLGVAPSAPGLIVRVNRNGSSIGSILIPAGGFSGSFPPSVTAINANDRFTVDVTQVGNPPSPGSDLVVQFYGRWN